MGISRQRDCIRLRRHHQYGRHLEIYLFLARNYGIPSYAAYAMKFVFKLKKFDNLTYLNVLF